MSSMHLLKRLDSSYVMKNITSIKREKFSFIWSIGEFGEFLNRKYEFSSPIFSSNSSGTSKWKLVIFPENVYPEGLQVTLRLHKMSTDDRCYSVMYTISLIDINEEDHQLHTRENVFRRYLDYDQCAVASNQAIKDKHLLQNNGTLVICCKIDLLVCENPDDAESDSLVQLCENNVLVMNDLSCRHTYQKQTGCEKKISNLSTTDLSSAIPNQEPIEWGKVSSSSSEVSKTLFQSSTEKLENADYNKQNSKLSKDINISSDESKMKESVFSEKIGFIHTTRQKAKIEHDNRNFKTYKGLEILSNDLNFLHTAKYQCDVTIHTNDGQIRAHKAILAARSDYFRQTLTQKDEDIYIKGINSVTLDAVLYYMYTGQSPQITFDHAVDILTACDMLHLDYLRDMVELSLKSEMNINNVTDILSISKEMKLNNLKTCALTFVGKNHEAVMKTLAWNQMITNDPHAAGEVLLTIASFQNKY